jgi:ribosomal-protein-alanine N-acetyltransferase
VYELQRLRSDHEDAVLNFEVENRAYFALSISDRGEEFFEEFTERHRELLSEQEAGAGAFYVLVGEDGTLVGRFNLYDLVDDTAVVGYRVAQHVAGRGVATTGLRDLCRVASEDLRLRTLKALTTKDNVASQRVLEKSGFVFVGPSQVAGRDGWLFELALTSL